MESLEVNYKQYKGKKVLITGHTGFKGAWLVAILNQFGAHVSGYALAPEKNNCIYNEINGDKKCDSIIGDIRDVEKLEQTVLKIQPDYIFHLAAQALVIKSYTAPSETFDVNVVGTANVLNLLTKLKKKCAVIVITTDKVYENNESGNSFQEADRLGGHDPYSASKACAELVVSSFRNSFFNPSAYQKHQKIVGSVRAGNVIGGGDYAENRLIPDVINSLTKNEKIVLRRPNSIRPWQHVLEPLFAYLKLGLLMDKAPEKYSVPINIGPESNDNITVKELTEIAIKSWGSGSFAVDDQEKLYEAKTLKLDISLALRLLNWQPAYNSKQAIEKTIAWYRSENKQEITNQQIQDYLNEIC
jgi:CDP-glucose 4,6-dehydratase